MKQKKNGRNWYLHPEPLPYSLYIFALHNVPLMKEERYVTEILLMI